MRCLLLAAGRGTRISRYLSGEPKCTVDVGNQQLIAYTVAMLKRHGINDIALSVGYRQQSIRSALADTDVRFYENPFFDVTNSIASAWFARDFFIPGDDLLLMNADVYLDEALLEVILSARKSPVLFADSSRREEADYKFKYENGLLLKYGKELEGDDITGEYIGAARIDGASVQAFTQRLERMISQQKHSLWWENVLYEACAEQPIYVESTQGHFWAEVDYLEDYERILKHRGYKLDVEQMRLERL